MQEPQNQVGFIEALQNYAKKPYSDDMNLWQWFLFTGMLIIMAALWGLMIRSITAIE